MKAGEKNAPIRYNIPMLRLAVLSDIHGNLPALQAVLAEQSHSVDRACIPDKIWQVAEATFDWKGVTP